MIESKLTMEGWAQHGPRWIAATKQALRAEVPDYAERFALLDEQLRDEAALIRAEQLTIGAVPQIEYKTISEGNVTAADRERIRRRGCLIVRGVFDRAQAEEWNEQIGRYIDENGYYERAGAKAGMDRYFSTLGSSKPQIFGLYWSRPQIAARQSETMSATRAFLSRLWVYQKGEYRFFDPDRQIVYADRVRRREPGDRTLGLSPHSDGGSVERWCEPSFRRLYREVLTGNPLAYDPWDGEGRTETREIPSPAVCSAFRTFQGWTALTTQGPGDGTLKLAPIANTMAWMLLRALQDDTPADDLCGAAPGRALGALPQWHASLLEAVVSIPRVEPGDAVWWHSDVIHAVEDEHAGRGYSNVIYIGASPWCEKNEAYLKRQAPAFLEGRSSPDFAPEDYEVDFIGRANPSDLSDLGRAQMGL
jgi:hypothetical protein